MSKHRTFSSFRNGKGMAWYAAGDVEGFPGHAELLRTVAEAR